jgi:hypothetical protein
MAASPKYTVTIQRMALCLIVAIEEKKEKSTYILVASLV